MAGYPEASLSQVTVVVAGFRSTETGAALGHVAVGVARDRSADVRAALRLIEVGRDRGCLAAGDLRPALGQVEVRRALLGDLCGGHPIGIGFGDLPLPGARGEGESGRGREQPGGDDALDVLRGVHDRRFARAGMVRRMDRYGMGMGASTRR